MDDRLTESVRGFAFPLNVYAALLLRETGRVDYLHYGLFEHADTPVEEAQARSTRLLFESIERTGRVLEVGIGLGTTLAEMTRRGWRATGITPDPSQVAFVRSRHGGALDVRETRFEDFDAEPGAWSAIVFQESAQYVTAPALFQRGAALLAGEGELLIIDEFALARPAGEAINLHVLAEFLHEAGRHGFQLVQERDFGAQARLTLDWLSRSLGRHAQTLTDELGVDAAALVALEASNQRYRERYLQGVFTYRLLRFVRRPGAPGALA